MEAWNPPAASCQPTRAPQGLGHVTNRAVVDMPSPASLLAYVHQPAVLQSLVIHHPSSAHPTIHLPSIISTCYSPLDRDRPGYKGKGHMGEMRVM